MKVLLCVKDLYKEIGGGQTVYRKIVESTPSVDFYYFVEEEASDAPKPQNVHSIKLLAKVEVEVEEIPIISSHIRDSLSEANQYARSVAGMSFDLLELPDYLTFGSFLSSAFLKHDVVFKKIILALHGNISKSVELNWGSSGDNVYEYSQLEEAQFKSADIVYGISQKYIKEWQEKFDRPVHFIDPIGFVNSKIDRGQKAGKKQQKPSLYCIGRSERRKGNDLFVELVRWLDREIYQEAAHIGSQDNHSGISSKCHLSQIASKREIEIDYYDEKSHSELFEIYNQKSVVVLPVRYDTLNLVALEALFSGCPIVISEEAGVCDYLDQFYPGIPYIKINFSEFYAASKSISHLINHYDKYREKLIDYLNKLPSQKKGNFESFYLNCMASDSSASVHKRFIYQEKKLTLKSLIREFASKTLSIGYLRKLAANVKYIRKSKLRRLAFFGDLKFLYYLKETASLQKKFSIISSLSEKCFLALKEKLDSIYHFACTPISRCNYWLEIARLERLRSNELIAVAYELRVLRLLGKDKFGLLPQVIKTLNKFNFKHEAEVAEVMFRKQDESDVKVYSYLKNAYKINKFRMEKVWERIIDKRGEKPVKVSVIVSLYNAADKLEFFLAALSQQTLVAKGDVEIILVDSGSPANEKKVFEQYQKKNHLNVVYARSAERETIQSAWNRGIGLSKAPYLVFLGVDETIYPETLELLSAELDADSKIDWVMSNSLVTEVTEKGVYKNDLMAYIRDGAGKNHTYLETCYLSWVGGMYRKSIHDRFGYYDESFGAAGDTEFKNRILPQINVKFVKKTLGIFLNYPDGQTTASPKAEIEDLRAWYVHRTLGGVRYAFENQPIAEAENLLYQCLGYRKSYCNHMSSDIEYGLCLAQYILGNDPNNLRISKLSMGLSNMQELMRKIETIYGSFTGLKLIYIWLKFRNAQKIHRKLTESIAWPCYEIFNDNRYEQHSWLWKSQ
jgi:glycosyltransferase involved in cell wall biosynthesis